jgi:hypothetical protein
MDLWKMMNKLKIENILSGRCRCRWEDDITMDLGGTRIGGSSGFIYFRIGTNGRLLSTW